MTILSAFPCGSNIPQSYRTPVQGPAALSETATVADLARAATDASAGLEKANGRLSDTISIIDSCDAHQKEVAKALQPEPWWKRAF